MDMNALLARKTAERAAKGLIAADGVACPTPAHKAYHDFRYEMRQRADWGNLPADLEARLVALKKATR